jgi:hypothetical protein
MTPQQVALVQTKLFELDPELRPLFKSGIYGVADKDYDTVATALLWTLEQGLGTAFTPEARAAWIETYVTLASVMKSAAAKAAA